MPGLRRSRGERAAPSHAPPAATSRHVMLRARGRVVTAAAALALGTALLAGCGTAAQPSGPQITLLSAQVTEPNADGLTDAYVVVENKGPAIQLIGARTSAGGTVVLRSPSGTGVVLMRTVTAITIPAHTLFRLDPNGSHLLITGSGPMKAGTEITLTLSFAHGHRVSAPAMVTNPATGGSSYFLN
jgi:copper(I)-binding protein